MHAEIATVWADSGCAGPLVAWAEDRLNVIFKTIRRLSNPPGCIVLSRRWVVKRSLSWIMRARRHCRNHERLPQVNE
ncbi:hypothetical protein ACFRAA_32540 [[Kitasatospora] papulosa]|uniref:hypothetical protein n=1 Tax=Streptomyces TaxID=1883 RepID=UPI0029A14131|nr:MULTISPECIES: hypothetical protein [unclassified Streptomyces]MDX3186627.1 hypothetical protein [Streptomyces sp. ME02-7008A-1]MDX3307351.1 hypothetical protein [Streptomyces sp. ME02-7008A]